MKKLKIEIKSGKQMRELGAKIAREISAEKIGRNAKVIKLVGDLGAGKTTFSQGFLKELGVTRRIISPTFLIIRPYKLSTDYSLLSTVYHIDCYRLNNSIELLSLGFKEIIENPKNIVLIEWPEIMDKYIPKNSLSVKIKHPQKGSSREVEVG
jgi:tRNA threonylcarbamoyladenosine biosynthesis protein TsaE